MVEHGEVYLKVMSCMSTSRAPSTGAQVSWIYGFLSSYCKTKRSCKEENFGHGGWVVVFEVDWGWIWQITTSLSCLNQSVPLCSMIASPFMVVFSCSLTPAKKNSSCWEWDCLEFDVRSTGCFCTEEARSVFIVTNLKFRQSRRILWDWESHDSILFVYSSNP